MKVKLVKSRRKQIAKISWKSLEWNLQHAFINQGCIDNLGRVENSNTFQNQMSQCFFIGLYHIETGDDFYFFQQIVFDLWKWISKKSISTRENGQNKPENQQN